MKASQHCRLGDRVTGGRGINAFTGEVVTIRNIGVSQQVLMVKTATDGLHTVRVDITPPDGRVFSEPARLDDAVALATAISAGQEPPMSLSRQILLLSTALLAVTSEREKA